MGENPTKSENASVPTRSARQNVPAENNAQQRPAGKPAQDWEDRRNVAACFKNRNKKEEWHPEFVGVMVTENLPAGTKCWVTVKKRLTRKGEVYVTVTLKPQMEGKP
jgi:hypothetical protein